MARNVLRTGKLLANAQAKRPGLQATSSAVMVAGLVGHGPPVVPCPSPLISTSLWSGQDFSRCPGS
jgi:hypothetical protein